MDIMIRGASDLCECKSRCLDAVLHGRRGRVPLRRWLLGALAVLHAPVQAAPVAEPTGSLPRFSIRWAAHPAQTNQVAVEVSELSAATLEALQRSNWSLSQWQRLLAVSVEPSDSTADPGLPSMLGVYRVQSGVLSFEPQFPLEPGVNYRAVFWPAALPGKRGLASQPITARFQMPSRGSDPTTVVRKVYPSADVLPENLLKFYIHFSAPMSRGHIYDHIQLQAENGKPVALPFLEIDEELWDPTMTRLTLLIDPGRIKRGVRPLEEVGPALEAGKHFKLVVDRSWKDGQGNPLKESFQKVFNVGPPDRDPPDPVRWKIEPPRAQTREPVEMTFQKSMDHALAQRVIRVTNASGETMAGETELEDHERRWKFTPFRPWRSGQYSLVVQRTLEDLAGNNIGKAFDVDVFETVQSQLTTSTVKLSFEVR
jgi:hypothetical protein